MLKPVLWWTQKSLVTIGNDNKFINTEPWGYNYIYFCCYFIVNQMPLVCDFLFGVVF